MKIPEQKTTLGFSTFEIVIEFLEYESQNLKMYGLRKYEAQTL